MGAIHLGGVTDDVAQLTVDVLVILSRLAGPGRSDVEVVAELACRWVDVDGLAAAALHEAGAALVKQITLGVGAAHGTVDEVGIGARAGDGFGGVEREPALDVVSGLCRHQERTPWRVEPPVERPAKTLPGQYSTELRRDYIEAARERLIASRPCCGRRRLSDLLQRDR